MASESESAEFSSSFERMLSQGELPLFLPFIIGLTTTTTEQTDSESENPTAQTGQQEQGTEPNRQRRVVLINPFTQSMVMLGGGPDLGSLFMDDAETGQPPASKASIDAMPSVEVGDCAGECAICLEEFGCRSDGLVVKEMPCKHRFHGGCIEKWLGLHGSCPVCRYQMPVEEGVFGKKSDGPGENGSESRRGIRVTISFGRRTNGLDSNQSNLSNDHEMQE